jgi:hypothetical protein
MLCGMSGQTIKESDHQWPIHPVLCQVRIEPVADLQTPTHYHSFVYRNEEALLTFDELAYPAVVPYD